MSKKLATWVFATLLASTIAGGLFAGPLKGPVSMSRPNGLHVPSSKDEGVPGETDFIEEFRGNERAAILIKGDHDPIVELELLVYQVLGNGEEKLVARDRGTRDLIGATWTPLKTGPYRIVVRNPSKFGPKNPYNDCYMVVR